ncbi:P-loop containing nucleoside triphosphate hydrolases superfamily protein [Artemisia annua]|uniref:P-loop containing nucleoside triphosphate hydrolases superfamily protein n=1 Tax=Artemisia annua TaxID=35608 RepID=A0A2U1LMR4_ARTAN|nr:P-loop containing nucleoside triphosphate hydrolases superfamily protein [Artemisia annua]
MENRETKLQKLVLYVARATFSSLVIFVGLKYLDPNREASKKALERRKEISKRLGRPLIDTNSYEHMSSFILNQKDVIASNVINPDHIDVELNSIGGLEAIKQSLYNLVILPLRRPELFSYGKLLGPQKGVLLYGPPGTGKTMLAKAIAKESGAFFINVTMSDLMSTYFGDTQKLVPTPNDDTHEGSTCVGREGGLHQPVGVVSSHETDNSEQIQFSGSESISQQPGYDVESATPLDENIMSEGNSGSNHRVPNQTEEVNLRKSSRVSKLPAKLNDFVLNTSTKYGKWF